MKSSTLVSDGEGEGELAVAGLPDRGCCAPPRLRLLVLVWLRLYLWMGELLRLRRCGILQNRTLTELNIDLSLNLNMMSTLV